MTRFNNSKLFHLCYIYCTKVPVCTYVLYTVQHSFLYGGFPGGRGGVRYTITVKISTEKSSPKQCIRRVESYLKDRKKSTKRAIKQDGHTCTLVLLSIRPFIFFLQFLSFPNLPTFPSLSPYPFFIITPLYTPFFPLFYLVLCLLFHSFRSFHSTIDIYFFNLSRYLRHVFLRGLFFLFNFIYITFLFSPYSS